MHGLEVVWNQQLRGGVVSVDLKEVAGRDLRELVEVLLINGLGGNSSQKFGDGWEWKEGMGESWRILAEDTYNVNSYIVGNIRMQVRENGC